LWVWEDDHARWGSFRASPHLFPAPSLLIPIAFLADYTQTEPKAGALLGAFLPLAEPLRPINTNVLIDGWGGRKPCVSMKRIGFPEPTQKLGHFCLSSS
ncbi:hypothetical protein, partial [Shimia marina]|uniref:hypothetical protein n=1 Tax=Shimia marina TaxID=321267 RepID=UPI001F470421